MNHTFHYKIERLKQEIIASIITIMDNNNLSEIDISDTDDPTYVVWWDNKDDPHENKVSKIVRHEHHISVAVETEDEELMLDEDTFTNLSWLASIRDNIMDALREKVFMVCNQCGKPINEEMLTDGSNKSYCSTSCLFSS